MLIVLATLSIFALGMAAMAVGVIFGKRPIQGSCGGEKSSGGHTNLPRCMCAGIAEGCRLGRVSQPESNGQPSSTLANAG